MKKKILFLGILFISIFCLTGCLNKNVLTPVDFKTKMEGKGFTVQAEEVPEDVSYIESAATAKKDEIEIQFYVFKELDKAKSIYDSFKSEAEGYDSKSSIEVNLGNHQKYEITTDKYFSFITRVDKTMVLVEVDKKYKNDTIDALKELGYY